MKNSLTYMGASERGRRHEAGAIYASECRTLPYLYIYLFDPKEKYINRSSDKCSDKAPTVAVRSVGVVVNLLKTLNKWGFGRG